MIKQIRHKGLRNLWNDGDASGLPAQMLKRIKNRLSDLDVIIAPRGMNIPGYDFHELKGERKGTYTVHVNGPWCITFQWDGDVIEVDFENYH